jgi:hypothetical protein
LELADRHRGSTIFVIGAGPQVGALDDDQRAALNERITIGVNRTQYAVGLRYFMSAYPAEILLAARRCRRRTTLVHIRPVTEPPLLANALALTRVFFDFDRPIPVSFDEDRPLVLTRRNVSLAATHLAAIMSAKRIAYVGVEQNSALHFYDTDPELRALMVKDLRAIRHPEVFTTDHEYATLENLVEKLQRDPEDLDSRPFYEESHVDTFAAYFAELRRHGIEVVATLEESVVAKAGAEVRELDELLAS